MPGAGGGRDFYEPMYIVQVSEAMVRSIRWCRRLRNLSVALTVGAFGVMVALVPPPSLNAGNESMLVSIVKVFLAGVAVQLYCSTFAFYRYYQLSILMHDEVTHTDWGGKSIRRLFAWQGVTLLLLLPLFVIAEIRAAAFYLSAQEIPMHVNPLVYATGSSHRLLLTVLSMFVVTMLSEVGMTWLESSQTRWRRRPGAHQLDIDRTESQ